MLKVQPIFVDTTEKTDALDFDNQPKRRRIIMQIAGGDL